MVPSRSLLPLLPLLVISSVSTAASAPPSEKSAARVELIAATPDSGPGPLDELPLDEQGRSLVGRDLPFLLCLRVGTEAMPSRALTAEDLFVAADSDLGDPAQGGVAAGENLLPRMQLSRQERTLTWTLRFDSTLSPANRAVTFVGGGHDDLQAKIGNPTRQLVFDDPVSLRRDIMPLLSSYCWPCHDQFGHTEHLEMTRLGIFKTAVNRRAHETPEVSCARLRIDPYHPESSYVVQKLQGTQLGGCVQGGGARMPLFGPYLKLNELVLVRRWIAQGCHDN